MVVGYGVAQVAYNLGLKQIVIIDVMTLAGLFILRVAAGASAVDARCALPLGRSSAPASSPPSSASPSAARRRSPSCTRGPLTRPGARALLASSSSTRWSSWSPPGGLRSARERTVNSPLIAGQTTLTIPPGVNGLFRDLYRNRRPLRTIARWPQIVAGDRRIQAAGAAYALVALPPL